MTVLADQKRGRNNEVTGKLLLRVSLLVPVYLNTEFSVASEFFVPDPTPDSFEEFLFKNAKLCHQTVLQFSAIAAVSFFRHCLQRAENCTSYSN